MSSVVAIDLTIPPITSIGDPFGDIAFPSSGWKGIIRWLRRILGYPVIEWNS